MCTTIIVITHNEYFLLDSLVLRERVLFLDSCNFNCHQSDALYLSILRCLKGIFSGILYLSLFLFKSGAVVIKIVPCIRSSSACSGITRREPIILPERIL